ncbi:MAG: hypothetical protein HY673_07305 [Chloroflexi bacterium]|nr:hypothetical protein [Chloroflexota bacterium]
MLRHRCCGGKPSQAPSAVEENTLRRWWNEYSSKTNQWAGLLESSLYGLFGRAGGFVHLPTDPLKRLEIALSRLPPLPSRWATLVKVLHWLLPSLPLCLNWPVISGVSWCQILEKGVDTS